MEETALTTRPAAALAEQEGTLAAILRAAKDPKCDVAKLNALLDARERFEKIENKRAYERALVRVQAEVPSIDRTGIIRDRSGKVMARFSEWGDIHRALQPLLSANGLAVTVDCPENSGSTMTFRAVVRHESGHSEEFRLPLAIDTSGAKNATQGSGSTQSYAKRYLYMGIFNIRSEGEDDDAAGGDAQLITQEQADHIQVVMDDYAQRKGRNPEQVLGGLLNFVGTAQKETVTALSQIRQGVYKQVLEQLTRKA